jgi:putative membrane protein
MTHDETSILSITRPKDRLWTYYKIQSLTALLGFPVMLLYLYFRFHTMRYRFDHEGISMSWGVIFHHETVVNYSRIQDIHLRSNAIERWLGLARVEIQTASAGAGAELTLEGMEDPEQIRDFLYSKMRGAKEPHSHPVSSSASSPLAASLASAAAELQAIRKLIEEGKR